MKLKLPVGLIALCGLALAPVMGLAQDSQDKSDSVRTLTGCLAKGEKTAEYKLTTSDGSTWEIKSDAVKLGDHVGHTVTVTGKVWHAGMHGAKEKTKDAVEPNAAEHGHLNVTDVSMVSDSCKK